MEPRKVKIVITLISLVFLAVSLTQNVLFVEENDKPVSNSSLSYFFGGSISIIGGGTFEWIVWLANPLALWAIFSFFNDKLKALSISLVALLLAVSFALWNKVLISESGATGKILSLELGYYLWLSSIISLFFGILYYFIKYKKSQFEAYWKS